MTKIDHPKDVEEFYLEYKEFVYKWLRIKKYDTIDSDEFFSSFIKKIIEKNREVRQTLGNCYLKFAYG